MKIKNAGNAEHNAGNEMQRGFCWQKFKFGGQNIFSLSIKLVVDARQKCGIILQRFAIDCKQICFITLSFLVSQTQFLTPLN